MVLACVMLLSSEMLLGWRKRISNMSMVRLPFDYTKADGISLRNVAFH